MEDIKNKDDIKLEDNNDNDNIKVEDNDDIDVAVLADLIKEKDEQLETMQKEIETLKKSNASLLVKVSAGEKHQEKTFEENLFDLVGRPTERK